MKKIIIFITIIFIQQTVFCQYSILDTTAKKNKILKYDAAYYNKKAKDAKKTAWFLVGTGIAMNLLADANYNSSSGSSFSFSADDLLHALMYYAFKILYPVPIAASFFYFANSWEYKKKSKLILP
jgi:hypothetical protein